MPPVDSSKRLAEALLEYVQSASYPDSEDVISADLPATSLPAVLKHLEQANSKLQAEVRAQSKAAAPDLDGWIAGAKQLAADIKSSKEEGQAIIQHGYQRAELESNIEDAGNKVRLLEEELAFNHELDASLYRLRGISEKLDKIQRDLEGEQIEPAVDLLRNVRNDLSDKSVPPDSKVAKAFSVRIKQLGGHASQCLEAHWQQHVNTEEHGSRINIPSDETRDGSMDLESVTRNMGKLELLDTVLVTLSKNIEQRVLIPRLRVQEDATVRTVEVNGDSISSGEKSKDLSAEFLFFDLRRVIGFLIEHLPPAVSEPLAGQLVPRFMPLLVSVWLKSSVPNDLEGITPFQETLALVDQFSTYLESVGWPGKAEIDSWKASIPSLWLQKRQEDVLLHIRRIMARGISLTKTVEREETQVLSKDDDVFTDKVTADDWNADWSDEDEEGSASRALPGQNEPVVSTRDEDVSAWGWDEEKKRDQAESRHSSPHAEDENVEAWGWSDDEDDNEKPSAETVQPPKHREKTSHKGANGVQPNVPSQEVQQVTLREKFTITSLPEEILDILSQISHDCDLLKGDSFKDTPISKCALPLSNLSALIVAFYRAGSPSTYSLHENGHMLLYNDSLWLADQLSNIAVPTKENLMPDQTWKSHVSALQNHGKRAYSQDMDSQRTIITDLLDGAQGFVNCTEHPFNQECDIAVASAIDRIRELHRGWITVLSHSALLQAIGSLLSTVCSKMITDIEDMSDISEPESQQLTRYCSRIATLEDIFTPQAADGSALPGDDVVPLTAAYVSSWFKFQYLANLLESSLADIKYMWMEGGLSLEFEKDEVLDLIVALFAEGPHRRTAIAEIRAT